MAHAMQEGMVLAKLLALYTIAKDGLLDNVRAAIALQEEGVCVHSYTTALKDLSEGQI